MMGVIFSERSIVIMGDSERAVVSAERADLPRKSRVLFGSKAVNRWLQILLL